MNGMKHYKNFVAFLKNVKNRSKITIDLLMIHQHCFRQKKQENMLVFSHEQFKVRENCHAFYMHNAHYCVRCCDASLLISHARAYVEVIYSSFYEWNVRIIVAQTIYLQLRPHIQCQ